MSILKLALNRSYEIALQYPTAQEKNGQYGKQFLYTLASPRDHVLYVPPVAHAEIQSLHVEPGELFTLTKSIGAGNAAVWSVERAPQPADKSGSPKPMAAARSSVPTTLTAPVSNPPLTTEESKRIFRQLVAVIDACRAAEAYSNQIDYPVSFGPEDIRAMAISGFIAQSRREAA